MLSYCSPIVSIVMQEMLAGNTKTCGNFLCGLITFLRVVFLSSVLINIEL